ncbi:MAG: hypothetical protein P8J74_06195 [Woeseiaceae bacterium]|nr:hypothetical protein [Woeseiaceae bacterium]
MNQQPLRLRKKHGSGEPTKVTSADGYLLVKAQSMCSAIIAGLITIILFSIFLVALSRLTDRVFPWLIIILGILLGHAIRLAGRGTDWRFPVIAAVMASTGAFLVNVVIAASFTAEKLEIGTVQVLLATTSMTWPVFFDEVLTAADVFYAVVAMFFAAFFSNRRLKRSEYRALRLLREEQHHK